MACELIPGPFNTPGMSLLLLGHGGPPGSLRMLPLLCGREGSDVELAETGKSQPLYVGHLKKKMPCGICTVLLSALC